MRLSGEVPSDAFADAVVTAATKAAGNTAVTHELQTVSGRPIPDLERVVTTLVTQAAMLLEGEAVVANNGVRFQGKASDQATADAITAALDGIGDLVDMRVVVDVPPPRIFALSIVRTPAMLEISGEVPNADHRARLTELAERQVGGIQVVDRMVVLPGAVVDGWDSLTTMMVRQFGSLSSGRADLTAQGLTLTGVVADPMIAEIMRANLEEPGLAIVPVTANIVSGDAVIDPTGGAGAAMMGPGRCHADTRHR